MRLVKEKLVKMISYSSNKKRQVFYESKKTRNRISSSVWNYSVKDGAEDDCESKMSDSPRGLQKLTGKRILQSSKFMQYKFANMNPGVKGFASNRKFSEF